MFSKKNAFYKILIFNCLQKKVKILIYAMVNTNYYTAIFCLYISILLNNCYAIIVMVFVSYRCTNGNVLIFPRVGYYDRQQEMVLKGSFGHILKGVLPGNVFEMKAGKPKKQNIP